MDPAELSFLVLGRVSVRRGALALESGRLRTQAVLAALLFAEGRPLTAAQLVDAVWGDELPGDAVAALRSHALLLRRLVEPGRAPRGAASVLVSVGDGYELRVPRDSIDALQAQSLALAAENARAAGDFEQSRHLLENALALWRGEVLAGVPGPFAADQRRRLSELRADLLEARFEVDLHLGRHEQVIGELSSATAEFPLRERLRGLRMTALYRCGRRGEALAVYTDTRRLLVEELGIEPGPALAELHQRVLDDDLPAPPPRPVPHAAPRAAADPGSPEGAGEGSGGFGAAGAGRPGGGEGSRTGDGREPHGGVRPAQLPRGIADFTGRRELVEELCAVLVPAGHTPPVVVITGMGGVGKTTLATHIALAIADRFPDGQLYADLRGVDDRPAEPVGVLAAFLRALAVADSDIPPFEDERAALLRSLLADRRMLLVLDNAGTLDQVIPLLPSGPGCAVLVTSRAMLPLPDATYRQLDVLSGDEARDLLARIVGTRRTEAESEAADAVIAACGRLPLAIRIIGARLVARPRWGIADVARRLADERNRLSELRCGDLTIDACFSFGYRHLPAFIARAFTELAVAAVPDLSAGAAAAVLGVDIAAATQVCESLVDLGLLQSVGADRYGYHDLLRLFAHTVDPDIDREAVLERLLGHYLATAKSIVGLRYPGHRLDYVRPTAHRGDPIGSEADAHAWLDAERTALIALHRQIAADHPELVPSSLDVAMLISEAVDPSAQSGQLAEALRRLLTVAAGFEDRDTELRARATLGLVLALDLGRSDEAFAVLEPARKILRPKGSSLLLGFVEHVLGAATLGLGRESDAIGHMAAAVEIFRDLDDPAWEGWACATLADRYGDGGQWDRAAESAQRAVRLANQLGGAAFESLARCQLARVVLVRDNDPQRAMALCAEAVDVARAHGRRLLLGWALHRLAEVSLSAGHPELAESAAAEAVSVLTEAADPFRRAHALDCRVLALTAQGRLDEARSVMAQ
ncbi:AfsR family transcriptional regulator [Nocardia huaxiensis]|uniref:AfsR family transcriptional regulator n=1 Tax=Nocardia huaxiensis TaxID=2755382 RepID=A0A7D6VFW8_9NOCA|nr:BTAD domain-containing putative transcriptional regulator [Nocardia huaxiensis]QLY29196.1 AfsR family transcriptional regulator [Nocardia huaxiensis]